MAEVRRVPVGDVELAVVVRERTGAAATPCVLLPGTGLTAASWDGVADRLAHTRSVYAVDLRGHGASAWPGRYSVAAMAEDVVGLLDRLAGLAGPVDLVGHSLGGLVALRVCAAAPGRVRRLVLEDVGMPHPRTPAPPTRPPGDLPFDWRVVEQVRPEVDAPAADWPAVLATLPVPVLVVAGGPTSFVRAEHVAELVATVTDGRAVTLDTGHEVHENDPEGFTAAALAFLDAP